MGSRTGFTDARERRGPGRPRKGVVRDLLETVLVCVIFVLFLRAFVFQQSEIPSGSMETTILIGDHVLVNRFLYAPTSFGWERRLLPIRDVRRGDIVVFKQPQEPEVDFIKRVIGLPGETVALQRGRLLIDGLPVEEPYLDEAERRGPDWGPRRIEPDHYILMGDHRSRSKDSREWGSARRDLIKGRAFMILFSTRTTPAAGTSPGQVSPGSLARKLVNLVFHSRWERCLSLLR